LRLRSRESDERLGSQLTRTESEPACLTDVQRKIPRVGKL
jgi:hypothetical protein